MQKLNIAILSYRSAEFGGGQGVYVKDISKALQIAGHNVEVISGPPYPNLDPGIKLIKLPGLNLFETFSFKDRLKKIQKIKAPTLIIHGKHDPMIHIKNAYKMHKLIPRSKLKIIEQMRHLIEPEILLQFEDDLLEHLRLAS